MFRRKGKNFFSLRYKMIILYLGCFVVPMTLVMLITYSVVSEIVKDKVSLSSYSLISKIGDNISNVIDNIHGISLLLIVNDDINRLLNAETGQSNMIESEAVAQRALVNYINTSKFISNIEIVGKNGVRLGVDQVYVNKDYTSQNNGKEITNLLNSSKWMTDGQLGYYYNADNKSVTFLRSLRDLNFIYKDLGLIKIDVPENILYSTYFDKNITDKSTVFIIDQSGTILSSSKRKEAGNTFDDMLMKKISANKSKKYVEIEYEGNRSLMYFYTISKQNWEIIQITPLNEMLNDNIVIGRTIILISAIFCIMGILIIILYLKRVLSPLAKISASMKEIERENYSIVISVDSNDEIGLLAKRFNRMAQKLDQLIKLVYSFEIKQSDAQLQFLRSQINPHFLYNTLDTIYWKARLENGNGEVAGMIRALAEYFRKSIKRVNNTVSVREELDLINNYVYIQKKRFEDKIYFSITVDEGLMECKTIDFVLQPLVENAIIHGIDDNGGIGSVDISIKAHDDKLIMEVADDGCGIDPELVTRLMETPDKENNKGLAIKNINDRIKLLYGEGYGLFFAPKEDGGTIVRAVQPLIYMNAHPQ